jgi:hypothetical protein
MKNMKRTALTLATLMAMAAPALAGVVIQIETKDHESSPPKVGMIEISAEGRQLMADLNISESGSDGKVIYRGDRGQLLVLDTREKAYFALDKKQVSAMGAQFNQAQKKIDEALKSVPEAQRAAVEQMMKRSMPQQDGGDAGGTVVKNSGVRAEKNGYPCVRHDVIKDGQKINELWVTDWKNIAGASEVSGVFEELGDFVRELTESLSGAMGGAGGGFGPRFGQEMLGQLSKLGGFPVYSREFGADGTLKAESNLLSAKETAFRAADFEPPADYKLRSMFGG